MLSTNKKNEKKKTNTVEDDEFGQRELTEKERKAQEKKLEAERKKAQKEKEKAEKKELKKKSIFTYFSQQSAKVKIIITFDTVHDRIKILKTTRNGLKTAELSEYPYSDVTGAIDGKFYKRLDEVLKKYSTGLNDAKSAAVILVLPDNLVAIDAIQLPTMKKQSVVENARTEIEMLYKNPRSFNFKFYVVSQTKETTNVSVLAVRKDILAGIFETLNRSKKYPALVTYQSNAVVNEAMSLNAKIRNKSFIMLDIKKDFTRIVMVCKGQTRGFAMSQLGYSVISDSEIKYEDTIYDHDVAELAVLNAIEAAKAKMLTVSADEASSVNSTETPPTNSFLDSVSVQQNGEVPADSVAAGPAAPSKVFVKTVPKKRPKFLIREIPESPEDFMYQNFRMFVKWAFLYADRMMRDPTMTNPAFVLVNCPTDFAPLVSRVNKEEKDGLLVPFRYLKQPYEQGELLGENLEMFGAVYSFKYNKENNI